MSTSTTLRAMVTPLASIFGSGFLVIVPILAGAVGRYAALAMAIVGAVAMLVGSIVRHNIVCAEPALRLGTNRMALRFEHLSDIALVGAYTVAVCLYLHILSAFVLDGFGMATAFNKSLLTSAIIGSIILAGLVGGLKILESMERYALYITLFVLLGLIVAFGMYDANQVFFTSTLTLPKTPDRPLWDVVRIVAGTLIVVQGFETTRYLGDRFDAPTRIRASRWSQYISTVIYVLFVGVALPITPILGGHYDEGSLVQLARAAAFFLPAPLIITAALSQFSAAVADTEAAVANLEELTNGRISARLAYLGVGVGAIALAWTGSPLQTVALASRAFAFYYLMQCAVAYSVCRNHRERALFIIVGLLLLFVLVFAMPVG